MRKKINNCTYLLLPLSSNTTFFVRNRLLKNSCDIIKVKIKFLISIKAVGDFHC